MIYNSSDVRIRRVRARNIYGPYTRTLARTGNLLQIVNSRRIRVSDLKLDQPDTPPAGYSAYGTEDIISIGGCSGCWGGDSWSRRCSSSGSRSTVAGGDPARGRDLVGDGGAARTSGSGPACCSTPGRSGSAPAVRSLPLRPDRHHRPARPLSNDSVQLRTAYTAWGRVRTDWRKADGTKVYMNRGGYRFTDLGGNWWRATLDVARMRESPRRNRFDGRSTLGSAVAPVRYAGHVDRPAVVRLALPHPHRRRAAAGARRPARRAVRLGPPAARLRQARVPRPPRPVRDHPGRRGCGRCAGGARGRRAGSARSS